MKKPKPSALTGVELALVQSQRVRAWSWLYLTVMVVMMVGLLGRVAQLKISPDPKLAQSVGSVTSSRTEMARRGDLIDRWGRLIATSTVGYRLFVDPGIVDDPATIAVDLARTIKANPAEVDRKIAARLNSRYVVVDHLLDDWQVTAIRQAKIKGVGLEPRLVRHYPHGNVAASLVGLVGIDHTGLAGVEMKMEDALAAENGRLVYLRDVNREALWIEPDGFQPGVDGKDVRLSIDLVIQEIAERHIQKAMNDYNAGGVRCVVMDCRTGEVLGMCDVLNNRPGWNEVTTDPGRAQHPSLGRNRCITDPYEPGSTFKPFVWAAATELGKARPSEVLPIPDGPYRTKSGRVVRDAHYYGQSDWRKVLVKSMNSGMAIVAERMTHRELRDSVRRFGFGEKTNAGLPGESKGMMTSARNWSAYTQVSVSFGHEIAVTPLQMVRAFSAFARDGTLPPVRMTSRAHENTGYRAIHRALSPESAMLTREIMRDVMLEGTGRAAQSTKYQLFGKSGTAQLPKKNGGGYHEDRYVSSFIAGAPFKDPRLVVVVVVDDPDKRKGHFGGAIAGPIVRDIMDECLNYLGVPAELGTVTHALVSADAVALESVSTESIQ